MPYVWSSLAKSVSGSACAGQATATPATTTMTPSSAEPLTLMIALIRWLLLVVLPVSVRSASVGCALVVATRTSGPGAPQWTASSATAPPMCRTATRVSPVKVEYIAFIVVFMLIQLTVDGGPVHSGIGRPTFPAKLCTIDAAASEPVAIAEATCGICVAMVSPAAKTPGTVVRQSASTAMGLAAAGVGSPNPTPSCSTNCDR